MPKIFINNKEVEFEEGMTVLQACELAGAEIPRFCYHERLSIAGNCRMCLVEVEKFPKPIASCAMPATDGMKIKTNSSFVEKSRKGIMEFLLANHPLDCPVCDQGGECDLQDQSMFYGSENSRYLENKRQVKEKNMGPLIKTQMTRCIHCTRCVRFATEVAGVTELGAIGRGEEMEITTYLEESMQSELSGNVIDLCPVGALTSRPYAFEARPWELKKTETIDVMDAVGSNIRIDTYGWEVKRVLPRLNESINEEWISDKTRFSCDGLLKQRIDVPYIRENGRLKESSWNEAQKILIEKIKTFSPNEIAGCVGGLVDMEALYCFKKFFKDTVGSSNIECREKKTYLNPQHKRNYIFNTSIQNIDKSDFILLIGSNPRHEATIVNLRIRKAVIKNNAQAYSIGNPGDLSYPVKLFEGSTSVIKSIYEGNHEIYEKLKNAKKPVVILGESALKGISGRYVFEAIKEVLFKLNHMNKNWNAFNVLTQSASRIGAIDLGIYSIKEKDNYSFFNLLDSGKFKFLYLLGSDEIKINKKNEFVVYQGSHGDRGAEIADIVLPGAAYTEKDGVFINLEGRVQKTSKASYPPGNSKEDWKILHELSVKMKNPIDIKDHDDLESKIIKEIKLFSDFDELPSEDLNFNKPTKLDFINEDINIDQIDYYYTNPISRASKTMSECRNNKKKGANYNGVF